MNFYRLLACKTICVLLFCTSFFFFQAQEKIKLKEKGEKQKSTESIAQATPLDTLAIERIMGMKGKANKGEYKLTVPQNDLSVEVDGFKIIPAMGLGTWVAFTPAPGG